MDHGRFGGIVLMEVTLQLNISLSIVSLPDGPGRRDGSLRSGTEPRTPLTSDAAAYHRAPLT